MKTFAVFALLLCACNACAAPPLPPPTPPPPAPVLDAAPAPPKPPCQAACDQMAAVCGPQLEDCVRTQAHIESSKFLMEPGTGHPQTCNDVAAATTLAQMRAVGACVR